MLFELQMTDKTTERQNIHIFVTISAAKYDQKVVQQAIFCVSNVENHRIFMSRCMLICCIVRLCAVFLQHLLQRQLENLVACSVDQWIDADVDESKDAGYIYPVSRNRTVLYCTNQTITFQNGTLNTHVKHVKKKNKKISITDISRPLHLWRMTLESLMSLKFIDFS